MTQKKKKKKRTGPRSTEIKPSAPRRKVVSARKGAGVRQSLAGFLRDSSRMATLAEVRDPETPTRGVGELSHDELVKLVLRRLRDDPVFVRLYMFGVQGVIDKKRAMREIAASSRIGLQLLEIEKEYLRLQVKKV